jgi:hypothetical protein
LAVAFGEVCYLDQYAPPWNLIYFILSFHSQPFKRLKIL